MKKIEANLSIGDLKFLGSVLGKIADDYQKYNDFYDQIQIKKHKEKEKITLKDINQQKELEEHKEI